MNQADIVLAIAWRYVTARPRRTRRALLQSGATPIDAGRNAVLAKEPAEISGIPESKTVTDLLDRKIELLQAGASLFDQPQMHDGARADALLAFAMGVQLVLGNAQRGRITRDRPAIPIMQFDQLEKIPDQPCAVTPWRLRRAVRLR